MAKKRKGRYSQSEKRAYWIGVGIASERYGDSTAILESKNTRIRDSARNGYYANNMKDLSGKIARSHSTPQRRYKR